MAVVQDLHILPRYEESIGYLYVEHCNVEQDEKAIAANTVNGRIRVPCADLNCLLLGPGTTLTHAAVKTLAESGTSIVWTGEDMVRCYAQGTGETRSSANLLRQISVWSDEEDRLTVIRKMYEMRFDEVLDKTLTLRQIRGMEGGRVRQAYWHWSKETGIPWNGRNYKTASWQDADPINRAISTANACLYGICHAAIVSIGMSPALGFVHTGKQLSFVYDIGDLYKTDICLPVAFQTVANNEAGLETVVRTKCREQFYNTRLMKRIINDLRKLFFEATDLDENYDSNAAQPGELWDNAEGVLPGGKNYDLEHS